MFNIDSKPESVILGKEGVIIRYHDGSELKFTEKHIRFTNKYGDVETIDSKIYQYSQVERPTYDELYEHWLKTK